MSKDNPVPNKNEWWTDGKNIGKVEEYHEAKGNIICIQHNGFATILKYSESRLATDEEVKAHKDYVKYCKSLNHE